MSSGWLGVAYTLTMAAYSVSIFAFEAAKASTKLGFSIARSVASIAPIPFLTASLNQLESLSLLSILLGESIASTSLTAASTSLDAITNLIYADDEASFSLASFVTLVRNEWAEHGPTGRSVTEVARAVAAWAAIQGFTKQWSEARWLRSTVELTHDDFKPPDNSHGNTRPDPPGRRRTISRVSVTDDVIIPGQLSQIISADIGEKETPVDVKLTSTAFMGTRSPITSPRLDSPVPWRSNYETWKNLRRLSKMVLAGYGGAGLLFFGTPLRPDAPYSQPSHVSTQDPSEAFLCTNSQVKDMEENLLIHVVEDAEAEAMTPPMRNVPVSDISLGSASSCSGPSRSRTGIINATQESSPAAPSSSYYWWNVLLGRHDREIFEGFAFTPADDLDKDINRSPLNPSSEASSPSRSRFHSLASSQGSTFLKGLSNAMSEGSHKKGGPEPPTAIIGDMRHIPRFWVLTDHGRRQVVLVVRGTMTFNELAADLTCEPECFQPATASSPALSKPVDDFSHSRTGSTESNQLPRTNTNTSAIPFPTERYPTTNSSDFNTPVMSSMRPNDENPPLRYMETRGNVGGEGQIHNETPRHTPEAADDFNDNDGPIYQVHGGMLRLARAMGSKGKPVHDAVSTALSRNRGYELVLCGHSLGAGVAALLALMWADPTTCRTVPSSGLPSNRRVSVYCFAPPCITSPSLSRLCKNLITSIVYSFDVVSRLSLGSIRDLNKAAFWLCEGQGEESTISLLRRSLKGKLGFGGTIEDTEDEKKWFIAVRKTLEANMYFAYLFPPGRVWWAVRNKSLHPSHQVNETIGTGLRLYEVQQVEDVFRQIEFKGDMLSSHLPHQYDRMLSELEL